MRVNSMTVTLRDPEGQVIATTVGIPEEPHQNRSVAVEKINQAIAMLKADSKYSYSTTYSSFYLAEIVKLLEGARDA
jgi:hypothetical protein